MAEAADSALHRNVFIAECVLGAVTGLSGGLGAAVAITVGAVGLVASDGSDMGGITVSTALMAWGLLAIVGIASWCALSVVYLGQGTAGLAATARALWIGLGCGVVAALPLGALLVSGPSPWWTFDRLTMGPFLLIPAAHLVWLRARGQRAARTPATQGAA